MSVDDLKQEHLINENTTRMVDFALQIIQNASSLKEFGLKIQKKISEFVEHAESKAKNIVKILDIKYKNKQERIMKSEIGENL